MPGVLLEATLRSVALFAAVWLLLKLTRLRDLRLEKTIWTVVLLVSLAMPALMRDFVVRLPAPAFPLQIAGRIEALAAVQSRQSVIEAAVWDLYLLVTTFLVARFFTGLWAAARLRRTARRIHLSWAGTLDVRVSDRVRAPASFGSTILLPVGWESWDIRKARAVIAHESAHILQHDCYRLWIASLYAALFWFNPCALWLRRRLNVIAELVSDEAAVALMGDQISYAQVLVNLATGTQPPRTTIGMAAPSTLPPRLERLLESDMSSMQLGRCGRLILMVAVVASVASAALADIAPLVLTDAQDSAVQWVSGEPLTNFYPPALRKSHVEGLVTCRLTVDATGRVTRAVAVRSTNSRLTLPAVAAAKTFHFNNMLSRPVIKLIAVRFKLK
jgi:beta-lactamase regulating signal transducer with metallopeptidase domain